MPRIRRRDFLRLAAAAALAAAASRSGLEPLLLARRRGRGAGLEEGSRYETRYFVCRICGGGCVLRGTLDAEGRLVRIEGDPRDWVSHGTPCVKGKTVHKILYDPQRLTVPLRRTNPERGFVLDEKGAVKGMVDPRWVEVSWDEALDEIADKMAEAMRTMGPQSIVFIGHGKGAALAALLGTPNVVKHHSTCHSTWDVVIKPMYGGVPNADMEHSRLIVSFGFDQGAGKSKNPFAWLFARAKARGAKIVVFEPRLSETASKATEWIPIKPGTDAAVALAMVNVIIEEGLYDEDFLRRYTNAPIILYRDTLTYARDGDGRLLAYQPGRGVVPLEEAGEPALEWSGEVDGREAATAFTLLRERIRSYTPEWAERISGVPAWKIRELAREFATVKPASIPHWKRSGGTGPNRLQGVETYKAIGILMALTGNVEVRGGWLYNRVAKFISKAVSKKPKRSLSELYPIPEEYRGKTIDEREEFPVYNKYLKEGAYQKVWYNILHDYPYPVKVVVVWGQGLQAMVDYDLVVEAIRHVVEDNDGLVVNVNIYPDEMATLADIVLPENTFLEEGPSIGFSKSFDITYRIHWVDGIEQVHPGTRSESWIVKQLAYRVAERLGVPREELEREYLGEYFLLSREEKLRKMIQAYNEKLGTSLTLEELRRVKVYSVEWKPLDLTKLKTPSGRIEIVPTVLAEHGYDPLPSWRDSFTYQGRLAGDEFVVVSSVFAMNRHSKTVNNEWLRYFLAKHHADKVWIHPRAAERLGVREGDLVLVEYVRAFDEGILVHAPRLRLLARVHVTEAVREDVIFIPHGTGQLSQFMASHEFGTKGGDGIVKPVLLDYRDPSASSADQDVIVRVRRYA